MRILTLDIETAPNLAYVWGLWDQNIAITQIEQAGEVICWAAKWLDEPDLIYRSLFHHGRRQMLTDIYALLSEADAVITYNGRKFDIPWLYAEFIGLGLTPPTPFKQIDLYTAVKKRFRLPSYKLDYVAQWLGLGKKTEHEGFELWERCMKDDADAWQTMRSYNLHDVELTEAVYNAIKPWIPNIPSFAAHTGEFVCPACGSADLVHEGHAYTLQGKFKRYRCRQCGKWSRDTHRVEGVTIREVAD